MTSDTLIVLIALLIFATMFVCIATIKLGGTIISPLRLFYPLKLAYRKLRPNSNGSILLATTFSDDAIALEQYANIGGYTLSVQTNSHGGAFIRVILDRSVDTHVVAIGQRSGRDTIFSKLKSRKNLSKVVLEGDYSDDIAMYCSRGKELELLQLFDPTDMAYFQDFCRSYCFEIYRNNLFISQAQSNDANDNTSMVQDAQVFLTRNKKLLDRI